MKTTPYFRNRTLRDRPELQKYLKEIADTLDSLSRDRNAGRWPHAAMDLHLDKYIRVIVEVDGETIRNAFLDRTYTRQQGMERR